MKISCQSCQAKYTIADEKVLGKIVKIRCKKCGATIVINGNEPDAAQAHEAPQQPGPGAYEQAAAGEGEAGWTVNVADGDQRTMSTAELVSAYQSGVVDAETYCWKDGMADWLPIREVSELSAAIGGGGAPIGADVPEHFDQDSTAIVQSPLAAQQEAEQAPRANALFGASAPAAGNRGGALFGAPAPEAAPAPAARRAGGRGGGGQDLFGAAAAAGGEDDFASRASSNASSSDRRTGERNENSVLFSLNALTAGAPKENENAMAQGEGSGLIDIRALSTSMSADKRPAGGNKADDIMNLSGGGAFAAALAAPVLAPAPAEMQVGMAANFSGQQSPPEKKGNLGLILGGVAAVGVLALAGVAAIFVLKKPEVPPAPIAVVATATAPVAATATAPTVASAVPAATAIAAATAQPPSVGTSAGAPATTAKSAAGVKPGTAAPPPNPFGAATPPPVAPLPPPPVTGSGTGKCGCKTDDFACNMACSAGAPAGGGASAGGAGSAASAPFDRGAAASALGGIAGNLSSCKKGDGPTGGGHVKVTFKPSGSVESVDVDTPPFSGTAVGGCVAGKFRSARVPAFSGTSMTVGKSFSLN